MGHEMGGLAGQGPAEDHGAEWGSLRADLDQVLAAAQQMAEPQSEEPAGEAGMQQEETAFIPQTDGTWDLPAWKHGSWSPSPHIVDPMREGRPAHWEPCWDGELPACLTTAGSSSQSAGDCTRQKGAVVFTAAAKPGRGAQAMQKIPQADGGGDNPRPYRLGSSRNRGRGRLVRRTTPTRSEQPAASQSSQRYAALSVSQSPHKPGTDGHGYQEGVSRLHCHTRETNLLLPDLKTFKRFSSVQSLNIFLVTSFILASRAVFLQSISLRMVL